MYYGHDNQLSELGIGVKAKVKLPKEVLAAAAAFPAFRVEFGRATTAVERAQAYSPWLFVGAAALVVWVVLVKGADRSAVK
jgi:hypothetical protein